MLYASGGSYKINETCQLANQMSQDYDSYRHDILYDLSGILSQFMWKIKGGALR